MAIKIIGFKSDPRIMRCLKCRTKLAKKYLFPRQIRCKRCGAINIFAETDMGHVVVTDPEHAARFTTKEEVKDGTEGQD